jgi:hypothetical protein
MEKKWGTVIPADLKRLFLSGTCVSLVTKGLNNITEWDGRGGE